MKITTLIKSILILLIILSPSIITRREKKEKREKKEIKIKKDNGSSSALIFSNHKLKQDENKDKILTDEALKRIFSAIGYQKEQFSPCLEKIEVNSKKSILAILIHASKTGNISPLFIKKIKAFLGCPKMTGLGKKLKDFGNLNTIKSVSRHFSKRLFRILK